MTQEFIEMSDVVEAVEEDDGVGFCLECGEEASGVEPDARCYECECCSKKAVFGAEELLFKYGGQKQIPLGKAQYENEKGN